MFRRIFWINLGLLAIIFLLGLNVYKIWFSIVKKDWKESLIVSAGTMPENEMVFEEEYDSKPSLYTYDVIADKNLFRPERTEWLPPMPAEGDSKEKEPPKSLQRNQPAMKEPVLYGVMITRDEKSALMKGSKREKPKERFREVRLGNGQVRKVPLPARPGRIVPDKVRTYHVGDEINESLVVDILPDRVILSKNAEEYELLLREPARLAAKNAPGPDQDSNDEKQPGLQTFPFQPGQFPNFPRPPGYPSPGFPAFQLPQEGQGQPGRSGFGYPVIPQPGRAIPKVPPRFQQTQRRLPNPSVYPKIPEQGESSSGYPDYSKSPFYSPNWRGPNPF